MIITNQNQTPLQPKDDKTTKDSPKSIFKTQNLPSVETSDLDIKLSSLTNKLLDALKSANDQIGYKPQILNQAKNAQIAPNLTKDLNELVATLKNEPSLAKLTAKLEEFLKPIEQIKNTNIAKTIQSSGIMLEAKIASSLEPQTLPSSIKELLSLMKNVSSKELAKSFIALASDESGDTAKSFSELKQILTNAKKLNNDIINNSNFKDLSNLQNKFENAVKFLDKMANLDAQKSQPKAPNLTTNQAQSLNQNQPTKISQTTQKELLPKQIQTVIKTIENLLQATQNKLSNTNFELPNLKAVKAIKNDLVSLLGEIKTQIANLKEPLSGQNQALQTKQNLQSLLEKSTQVAMSQAQTAEFIKSISTDINSSNLQDKLTLAAKKLSNIINFFDKNTSDAKLNLAEIKHLLKATTRAANDIPNIAKTDESATMKSIENDLKATLLKLKDQASTNPNQASINQTASRLLNQIEMHQLISYAQNSLQTYLPYTWDGLDSSSLAFKQGKKNKFYARLELNFIKFGSISVILGLSQSKYIDISIATQTNEFKDIILNSSKELKTSITDLGLIISSFSLIQKTKSEPYSDEKSFDLGFSVKA
ncbi:hypothetical protein CIG2463D_1312 [Campylobacter iguaniorum]|uniref:flagellar hook-length control protein FliK n=1 Tax=Campylobacter iguaniorum TaxID=1244531 RepID=UPI000739FD4A|nr:flagellar hook-length control protein FliK [Campylobacter iguaniorum]ALV24882.1 hypothetical protein CIG2463D_1312 [Campylobacter iguaniorum]